MYSLLRDGKERTSMSPMKHNKDSRANYYGDQYILQNMNAKKWAVQKSKEAVLEQNAY